MSGRISRIYNIIRGVKLRGYRLANALRHHGHGNPDMQYLALIAEQITMRAAYSPTMDTNAIRTVLRNRQEEFDGHLIFFAASDFGLPVVFIPAELTNQTLMLNAVLETIHEQKWQAENEQLRSVRHQVFNEVTGIHQGLPALCYDDGSAAYDIVYGWHGVYNFLTIRQVVGLVDWVANANEKWLDGSRITY